MNRKAYWKLRKIIRNIVFKIKKNLYRIIDYIAGNGEYKPFKRVIIKFSFWGILKGMAFSAVILLLDHLFLIIQESPEVDKNIFVPSIIGDIGIAGVILGLYCSNVAAIYSSKYANAPRNAFQYDKLTRRCISGIVDYIIFGFVILTATMPKDNKISWIVVTASVIRSIAVIISYSIVGNRAY